MHTNLMQSLESLSQDERLSRVFSANDREACDFTLWILELKKKKLSEYRLIYAWVIPRIAKTCDVWTSKNLFEYKETPYTIQIHRLTLHHSGENIFNLVKELCGGLTLKEACQNLEISMPANPHNKEKSAFTTFSLAKSSQELGQLFTVRPVVFLKHQYSLSHLENNRSQSISSPNEIVPAFMGSLVRLKKINLFEFENQSDSSHRDRLIKRCAQELQKETGLNFCDSDSKRLGNIEWLCFPGADKYEKSVVKIKFDSPAYTATIEIPSGTLPIGTQITIRCRLYNYSEISLDRLQTLQIPDSSVVINFTSQQEITDYLVTIWIKQENTDEEEIWYESSAPLLKKIKLEIGLVSLQGKLKSNWLEEPSKNQKFKKEVEQAQEVSQVHYEQSTIERYNPEYWNIEGNQIYSFVKRVFAKPSNALFIKNGWGSESQEPGILTFFKWLKALTNNPSVSKIIILDPYFDESGIEEVIVRAGNTQAEYVVIANTQANSLYPCQDNSSVEREPARATRLKEICNRPEIKLLLSNLKFELSDLRSKSETKNQLFHDRYLITYNQQSKLHAGYHLSNSIQGATKNYPLLITPIPVDTLSAVEEYVNKKILAPSSTESYQRIKLFSSVSDIKKRSVRPSRKISNIPYANIFFSKLLQDEDFVQFNEVDLCDRLKEYGKIGEECHYFEFNNNQDSQVEYYFQTFTQVLINSDLDKCIQLWAGLCGWIIRTSDEDEYLNKVINYGEQSLASKLQQILIGIPHQLDIQIPLCQPDARLQYTGLTAFLELDFPRAIQKSGDILRSLDGEIYDFFLQDYGIFYAIQVLTALEPEKITQVILDLKKALYQIINDDSNSSRRLQFQLSIALILKKVVYEILSLNLNNEQNLNLVQALLRSDIPLMRAIAARGLYYSNHSEIDSSLVFFNLSCLPNLEQLYSLAEWIFNIRIESNRQPQNNNEYLQQLQIQIFNQMRACFLSELSEEEFSQIVSRLSGPIKGAWSNSITQDFLIPLCNEGKYCFNKVTEFWLSFLFDKLTESIKIKNSEQKKQEDRVSYLILPDIHGLELMEVGAWAIMNSSANRRTYWIAKLIRLQNKAQSILSQPFLRYRHNEDWYRVGLCLLWIIVLTNLLLKYNDVDDVNIDTTREQSNQLRQFVESIDDILAATFEENPRPEKKWLWDIVSGR